MAATNLSDWNCLLNDFMKDPTVIDGYDCPYIQFASSFIFELFEFNTQYGVRTSFNDKYYDLCGGNFIDNESYICEYYSFVKQMEKASGDY